MASGKAVLEVLDVHQPVANYATHNTRTGGSTPGEIFGFFDFDDTVIEYVDLLVRLNEDYAAGGLNIKVPLKSPDQTSGVARMGAGFRRIELNVDDLDASHTYSFVDVDVTVADVAGELVVGTIAMAHATEMDGMVAGDYGVLRIRRNAPHANDTLTGDAQVWADKIVGLEQ